MYNSLFHLDDANCLGSIYIDLTANIRIVAVPILTSTSVKIGTADFVDVQSDSKKEKPSYVCATCQKIIQPTETKNIGGICTYCGKILPTSELFKASDENTDIAGFFCNTCLELKKLKAGKSLLTIVSKISLTR